MGARDFVNPNQPNSAIARLLEYDDYRSFLRDYFIEEKALNPRFSHRWFARKAGFSSSGHCALLISGARNLGEISIGRLIAALGLAGRPAEFLDALIRYNQAKRPEEKRRQHDRLRGLRQARPFRRLESGQHAYWESWYHAVIRELAVHASWEGDYNRLARLVRPPVSAEKARRAVDRLLAIGLLEKGEDGQLRQAAAALTAEGTPRALLQEFKREMMLRSLEAFDTLPPELRHVSMATLCVSRRSYDRLVEKIDRLRAEMLEAALDDEPEVVLLAGFHLVPLSMPFARPGSPSRKAADLDGNRRSGAEPS